VHSSVNVIDRQRIFENRVLRRKFKLRDRKSDDACGEQHDEYPLSDINMNIKSRRMRWKMGGTCLMHGNERNGC
jgi:hypothetical protein